MIFCVAKCLKCFISKKEEQRVPEECVIEDRRVSLDQDQMTLSENLTREDVPPRISDQHCRQMFSWLSLPT